MRMKKRVEVEFYESDEPGVMLAYISNDYVGCLKLAENPVKGKDGLRGTFRHPDDAFRRITPGEVKPALPIIQALRLGLGDWAARQAFLAYEKHGAAGSPRRKPVGDTSWSFFLTVSYAVAPEESAFATVRHVGPLRVAA
jgi:hypothetical protein